MAAEDHRDENHEHVEIREAATVLVLLPTAGSKGSTQNFRVCMVKRHSKMVFMGNHFVFPGGRVDADDSNWSNLIRCNNVRTNKHEKLCYRIAAIREAFEEVGILCARKNGTSPSGRCKIIDHIPNVGALRNGVHKGTLSLKSLCSELNVAPDVEHLLPLERWITPPGPPRRFDAWFYVAALPDGADIPKATADNYENTELIWVTPAEALRLNREGKIHLGPPQVYALTDLSLCRDIEDVIELTKRKTLVENHGHWITDGTGARCELLPGDYMYELDSPPESHKQLNRIRENSDNEHSYWEVHRSKNNGDDLRSKL